MGWLIPVLSYLGVGSEAAGTAGAAAGAAGAGAGAASAAAGSAAGGIGAGAAGAAEGAAAGSGGLASGLGAAGSGISSAAEGAAQNFAEIAEAANPVQDVSTIANPSLMGQVTNGELNGISSQSLNNFAPDQSPDFLDKAGEFGKKFGLNIAKQLIQKSLQKVPGGSVIGDYASQSFKNPTVSNLFKSTEASELDKRDALIDLLMKQQLGRTNGQ